MSKNEKTDALKERLLKIILDKCFRLGDFTLSSGRKSEYYIDGRIASLNPEGLYCIGKLFLESGARFKPDAVGGMTLGADPIVGAMVALSNETDRPMRGFIVRKKSKDHGTGKLVEGEVLKGDRVVIVEDVVTSCGSALQAVQAAHALGAEVKAILAVVDREEGGAEEIAANGLTFISIYKASELKKIAKEQAGKK